MVSVQAAALVLKLPPTNTKAQWRSPLERRMLISGEPVQLRGECALPGLQRTTFPDRRIDFHDQRRIRQPRPVRVGEL